MSIKGELKLIKLPSWTGSSSKENTQVTWSEAEEHGTRTAQSWILRRSSTIRVEKRKCSFILHTAKEHFNGDINDCQAKSPLSWWLAHNHKSHMHHVMSPGRKLPIVRIIGWPKVNPALSELASRLLPDGATLSCKALRFERPSATSCRVMNRLVSKSTAAILKRVEIE